MKLFRTIFLCIVILAAAAGVTTFIFMTEPEAGRNTAVRQSAMLVQTTRAEAGDFRPEVSALGTVEPARDVILQPRVSGEVIERATAFTPGGYVKQGEVLLRIDPLDYQLTVRRRKSDLQQAEAELEIEQARQSVARTDLRQFDEQINDVNRDLVLRIPQMRSVEAAVESARAALDEAELALQRTTIRAPFDAHVLSRGIDVGSQVSPGIELGRLVGMDRYWVSARVPVSQLRWFAFPEDGRPGSRVTLRNRSAWPEGVYREGRIKSLVGALEPSTRLAQVLVVVEDPLAREPAHADLPPLVLGTVVEARIEAQTLSNVVRVERPHVRENDTIWVMEDGELRIREMEIPFRDEGYAYVASGLEDGDAVVTTNLATVVEGAALRTETPDATTVAADTE